MADIYEVVKRRRTIRRFTQQNIERGTLEKLVDAARVAPSGGNLQPFKYVLVNDKAVVDEMFPTVNWAAYLAPHGTPGPDERPVAFIVVLVDTEIRKSGFELCAGAAVQNILLCAESENIGSCWMGSINRDAIRTLLHVPEKYIINTVIALGYKGEEPVTEPEQGSIKYYKDENNVLHVPKRSLEDIIVRFT